MNIHSGASGIGGLAELAAMGASNLEANALAAQNQAVAAAMPVNVSGQTANATMNNGRKDTTHADVQKLQQQLNDIKEQVFITFFRIAGWC